MFGKLQVIVQHQRLTNLMVHCDLNTAGVTHNLESTQIQSIYVSSKQRKRRHHQTESEEGENQTIIIRA